MRQDILLARKPAAWVGATDNKLSPKVFGRESNKRGSAMLEIGQKRGNRTISRTKIVCLRTNGRFAP
jgi:hypothetical protein